MGKVNNSTAQVAQSRQLLVIVQDARLSRLASLRGFRQDEITHGANLLCVVTRPRSPLMTAPRPAPPVRQMRLFRGSFDPLPAQAPQTRAERDPDRVTLLLSSA